MAARKYGTRETRSAPKNFTPSDYESTRRRTKNKKEDKDIAGDEDKETTNPPKISDAPPPPSKIPEDWIQKRKEPIIDTVNVAEAGVIPIKRRKALPGDNVPPNKHAKYTRGKIKRAEDSSGEEMNFDTDVPPQLSDKLLKNVYCNISPSKKERKLIDRARKKGSVQTPSKKKKKNKVPKGLQGKLIKPTAPPTPGSTDEAGDKLRDLMSKRNRLNENVEDNRNTESSPQKDPPEVDGTAAGLAIRGLNELEKKKKIEEEKNKARSTESVEDGLMKTPIKEEPKDDEKRDTDEEIVWVVACSVKHSLTRRTNCFWHNGVIKIKPRHLQRKDEDVIADYYDDPRGLQLVENIHDPEIVQTVFDKNDIEGSISYEPPPRRTVSASATLSSAGGEFSLPNIKKEPLDLPLPFTNKESDAIVITDDEVTPKPDDPKKKEKERKEKKSRPKDVSLIKSTPKKKNPPEVMSTLARRKLEMGAGTSSRKGSKKPTIPEQGTMDYMVDDFDDLRGDDFDDLPSAASTPVKKKIHQKVSSGKDGELKSPSRGPRMGFRSTGRVGKVRSSLRIKDKVASARRQESTSTASSPPLPSDTDSPITASGENLKSPGKRTPKRKRKSQSKDTKQSRKPKTHKGIGELPKELRRVHGPFMDNKSLMLHLPHWVKDLKNVNKQCMFVLRMLFTDEEQSQCTLTGDKSKLPSFEEQFGEEGKRKMDIFWFVTTQYFGIPRGQISVKISNSIGYTRRHKQMHHTYVEKSHSKREKAQYTRLEPNVVEDRQLQIEMELFGKPLSEIQKEEEEKADASKKDGESDSSEPRLVIDTDKEGDEEEESFETTKGESFDISKDESEVPGGEKESGKHLGKVLGTVKEVRFSADDLDDLNPTGDIVSGKRERKQRKFEGAIHGRLDEYDEPDEPHRDSEDIDDSDNDPHFKLKEETSDGTETDSDSFELEEMTGAQKRRHSLERSYSPSL